MFVFLKNVLMSSRFLVWNLFPLWIVRSRKSTEVVLVSCVNLIVGFSWRRRLFRLDRESVQITKMSSMYLFQRRGFIGWC